MFRKFVEEQIRTALEKDFQQVCEKANKINFDKSLSTENCLYFSVETIWEDKTILGIFDYNGVMFIRNDDYVFCIQNGFSHIV